MSPQPYSNERRMSVVPSKPTSLLKPVSVIKLRCGHSITMKLFGDMYALKNVRCPTCGQEWCGWQVIFRDKSAPKRELRDALYYADLKRKRVVK